MLYCKSSFIHVEMFSVVFYPGIYMVQHIHHGSNIVRVLGYLHSTNLYSNESDINHLLCKVNSVIPYINIQNVSLEICPLQHVKFTQIYHF